MQPQVVRPPANLAQWVEDALSRAYIVELEPSYYEVIAGDQIEIGITVGLFDCRPYFAFSGFSACLADVPWTSLIANVSERAMLLVAEGGGDVLAIKFRQEDIVKYGDEFMQEILASKYVDLMNERMSCEKSIRSQKTGGSTDSLGMIFEQVYW